MKNIIIFLFLGLSLSITGCDQPGSNTPEKPQSQKNTEYTYPGKPAAPVQLEYQLVNEPHTGIPLSITLTIIPVVEANTVTIHFNTSPELVITDTPVNLEYRNLPAGQPLTRSIQVIPMVNGKHYLGLNVHIDSVSGRSGTRSFSINFTTGVIDNAAQLPNATTIQPAPDGEKLIIQKGVETRTVEP